LEQLFRQSEEIIIIKRNYRHWCWQMCWQFVFIWN